MSAIATIKKNYPFIVIKKLIIASALVGVLSSFLAIALKKITEHYETLFFFKASNYTVLYFLFPLIGLTIIFFLRLYLFKNKENKGITEIFESTKSKTKNLPVYKIPSHFINGFFTVIFGGSTGIEVSTVVATATIGSVAQQKGNFLKKYKTDLICAGVAAGITILFNSPIAGILFALEVISRKVSRTFLITTIVSVVVATLLLFVIDDQALFSMTITTWNYYALPYFILLGILAGINSVFLTKTVIFIKSQFKRITNSYHKIFLGTIIIGTCILFFPTLYGDGYHGIKEIILHPNTTFTFSFFISVLGILVLKPVITSVTLASGGDGGVFAPSLVIGASLGFLTATVLNTFFHANVIPINFIIIGMAAVLSASIHAPFTALFLICGVINDYTLFFPILMVCLVSKYSAKFIYPHTVYSFPVKLAQS